jgi:cytidylate kinase
MEVITISRQLGSQGDYIASMIASMMDYRLVDSKSLIAEGRKRGLISAEYASEMREQRPPLFTGFDEKRTKIVYAIRSIMREIATKGKLVIVGLGASLELKKHMDTFNVRIIADAEIRVARIMQENGLSREKSVKMMKQSDRELAEYVKHFFLVDWSDPELYDLVISTNRIAQDLAVRLILQLVRNMKQK